VLRTLAGALVLSGALSGVPLAQTRTQSLPPLPDVVVETFPPQARARFEAALAAVRARPRDAPAVGQLAMTLHAWEQWEAARAAYRRAQVLAPESAEWWYLGGLVLQRQGQPAEAVPCFERAIELAPTLLPARARLAEALFDAGAFEGSARALTVLAAYADAAPVVALGRGRLAAQQGRHVEAVAEFERAIALFPEFGAAYYGLGQSLRALGRREEAVAAIAQHRMHGPRWPAIADPLAARVADLRDDPRGYLTRGLRQAELGDLPGAIALHEEALARDPGLAQARANLITLYGRTGQFAKADEQYRALLTSRFNEDEAHYNYGVLLALQRRWADAAVAYERALAANPLHAQAHNNLGQLLEGERKLPEALERYRRAVAADPQLRVARYNLGRMLLSARRFDEAAAEFAMLREPADAEAPRYLFALAVAHVQGGRREEGLAVAREARQLAERFGQHELVAAIDRDLAALK
jgi:tetratricopeptide (TPR) repeat protein